jgi:hypothetical protein
MFNEWNLSAASLLCPLACGSMDCAERGHSYRFEVALSIGQHGQRVLFCSNPLQGV